MSFSASLAVNRLAQDYAGKPVVFLEYNLTDVSATRMSHFQAVHAQGGRMPFIMVDSGFLTCLGPQDFYGMYQSMLEAALAQPAGVELSVSWQVVNNQAQVTTTVKNTAGVSLGSGNSAHLHLIAYREQPLETVSADCQYTGRYGVGAYEYPLSLASGAQTTLTKTLPAFPSTPWEQARVLAVVDYQPARKGAFNSLQAAYGVRADKPRLSLAPDTLALVVAPQQGDPAPRVLKTSGTSGLRWTAAVLGRGAAGQTVPWLQLAPTQGVIGDSLQVRILSANLADGANQATIRLSSPENRFDACSVEVSVTRTNKPVLHLPVIRK